MRRLDLNLLTALNALLSYESVSGAATQLGLSQPTLSASLAKLRVHYGDALLVRRNGRYHLTPLAQDLAPRVAHALRESERVLEVTSNFDPATSDRRFRVRISDYAISVLGPQLLQRFETEAPLASLQLELLGPSVPNMLESGDGAVLPLGALTDFLHLPLFEDRWVCAMNARMGANVEQVTVDLLRSSRMIGVFDRPNQATTPLRRLAMLGIEGSSKISVDSYLAVPFLLENSRCIVLMPERAALPYLGSFDIVVRPCDVLGETFTEAFWWDTANDPDPGHRWFRELLRSVGTRLEPPTARR
ncbi:MAG: LysR family transcriptional regulator [Actinomycetota bacterium]|nr:LysR family transcriptional regulator [Actinomycetota bacterium]